MFARGGVILLEARAPPPERCRADVVRLRLDARDRGVEERPELIPFLLQHGARR
jgi:hypothetical protein